MSFTTQWQANHAYSLTAVVRPTTFAGYTWKVTTAGTSGGTEPAWPADPSATPTIVDGTVTWSVGTGFRQAFQEALANTTTGILIPFAQANPDLIRSVLTVRPLSFTGVALPCLFVGDITEQARTMNGVRQRVLSAPGGVVCPPSDPAVPNDQLNFLSDVLADLFTANYHAVSGRSILEYTGTTDTEYADNTAFFPGLAFALQASVQEGRI